MFFDKLCMASRTNLLWSMSSFAEEGVNISENESGSTEDTLTWVMHADRT